MQELPENIHTVFAVVANANQLTRTKDNKYIDPKGNIYHLDRLGFHKSLIFNNHLTVEKQRKLDKQIRRYNRMIQGEELGRKGRRKVIRIINRPELPDKEKIRLISEYVRK